MAFYRKVLLDPKGASQTSQYRDAVAEALAQLVTIITTDSSVYARVRQHFADGCETKEVHESADDGPVTFDRVLASARREPGFYVIEARSVPSPRYDTFDQALDAWEMGMDGEVRYWDGWSFVDPSKAP